MQERLVRRLLPLLESQPYFQAENPQIIAELGRGDLELVVNVVTHGDKIMPLFAVHKVVKGINKIELDRRVRFTIANPPALRTHDDF